MGAGQGPGGGVGLRDAGVVVWELGVEEQGRATRVGGEIGEWCTVVGAGVGPGSEEAEGYE